MRSKTLFQSSKAEAIHKHSPNQNASTMRRSGATELLSGTTSHVAVLRNTQSGCLAKCRGGEYWIPIPLRGTNEKNSGLKSGMFVGSGVMVGTGNAAKVKSGLLESAAETHSCNQEANLLLSISWDHNKV